MKKIFLLAFAFVLKVLSFSPSSLPSEIQKSIVKPVKTTSFLIAGDVMLDRLVYHQFKDEGLEHVFDRLGSRFFRGVDLTLVNLEGPISDQPIVDDTSPNNLLFNFSPETPQVLKSVGINTVSLANNHTLNAGQEGLTITRQLLDEVEIKHFGGESELGILRIEAEIPLSVIGVNLLKFNDQQAIITAVRQQKLENRFVIVFPHWGDEYQPKHSASQAKYAYQWIENGADLVVGSHPHVIQDLEIYQAKPIIYSLGNFVFDQTFSGPTQQGLIIGGVVSEKNLTLTFFPIKSVGLQPELMRGEEKQAVIKDLGIEAETINLPRFF